MINRTSMNSTSLNMLQQPLAVIGRRSKLSVSVMAALFAATAIGTAMNVHAADDKAFADLQSENARLKQIVDKLQLQINAQQSGQTGIQTTTTNANAVAGSQTTSTTNQAATASQAEAQQSLEKVVIRAPNPLVQLQDVPKSISVVTGAELEKTGALNVTDILKRIGNVQWNYGNPKTGSLSIRGVSAGSTEQIDPSLGVNVDGVPYAYVALASGSDYIDVATIDVTRGPQGSTGGKNTSMGTINITTNKPTFTPEANASITFGQQNALITQAAFGGAVVDDVLAWRGTFYRNQQEGFYMNQFKPIEDRTSYTNTDRSYGRVQFLLTPNKDFSALFSADFKPKGIEWVNGLTFRFAQPLTYADGSIIPLTSGAQVALQRRYFTAVSSYSLSRYYSDPVNEDDNRGILNGNKGASAQLNWKLPNFLLTSITAFKNNFFQAANDDGTPFDITRDAGLFVHYKQVSQELRLTSNPGGFVDYTGGLFWIHTKSDANTRTFYGSDAGAWFATTAQYNPLDPNTSDFGSGRALLKDSLDHVYATSTTYTDNKSAAVYGQADWHLSEPLTLTTGLRYTNEDRRTSVNKLISDSGFGSLLNPAAYGGFTSAANLAGLQAANNSTQLSAADRLANQYFGAPITAIPGAAYAGLTAAQKTQVTQAQAIRAAQAYNGLFNTTAAQPYQGNLTTGNISLSYKLNDSLTTYGSWQHGAKAGISQISGTLNGVPRSFLTLPETSNAFELGLKTSQFNNTLTLNADVFLDRLKNFQQSVNILDPVLTANTGIPTYTSITGNAPLVEIRGLEIDASYTGIQHTTVRLASSFNDAYYKDSILLSNPVEKGNLPVRFYDAKGQTLANAPRFTANLSVDYSLPVLNDKVFHTNLNYNYKSRFNSDAAQSSYAWVNAYGLVDFSIGLGRRDRLYDFNFLVKNLLNTNYNVAQSWNSTTPGLPRWFGFVFSGKL